MHFTLYYRGLLKSSAGTKEKQALRRHFHRQLQELWKHKPLSGFADSLLNTARDDTSLNIRRVINGFDFAPLVCTETSLVAELAVTLHRPQAPGAIVGSGGDIDNRVKILLDALRVPSETTAIPSGDAPREDETPFFCLLEDDKLVTALSVHTDRLLEPDLDPNEVLLLVRVTTKHVEVYMGTIGLG